MEPLDLSPADIWTRLLNRAKLDLPEQTFRTWLEPTEALQLDGDTLIIGVPDQFAADWNDTKHAHILAGYAPVALGQPIKIVFRVHEERKNRPQMDFFVAPKPEESTVTSKQTGAATASLNDRYTFAQFVIGKSNELAAAAAHAIAQAPGKIYNPFFIYGDTGLGKTHLMQAVGHAIRERDPHTRIMFVGAEQFTNEMVHAIQTRTNSEFRRRYRETDLLLIDDVQFLKGKESTQEEFFHTFNALYEAGRQIIITSDLPPSKIGGLEPRLVTRFQWGMVADIELPDFEHRIAILQQKAQQDDLETTIPDDVIRFVAEHVRSSVRELEGSIIKLLAYASLRHKPVTIEVAREALRDRLRPSELGTLEGGGAGLTIQVIQQAVAKEWGITVEGLRSKTRTKTLTVPRQIAMHLTREMLGLQLVEIGSAFGGRDHSTVIHSLEKVAGIAESEPQTWERITRVRGMLESLRI
ncbi:MAG TPA: chromosomal replication initiator protein DnaA [Gemmatimonadaceae bacterium]|jgi:chromosomal replication initiator protein|nr:chromosomal replication initiator protein DnaA [Gemmatimonadaceae bacterium]